MKKTKHPLISIVIVAGLNRKKDLFRCLSSIKKSVYKKFEIIVVDNSQNPRLSSDIEKSFPQVHLFRMPTNTGIFGFNVGFANANGNYILTLDDDCSINSDTLKNIVDCFRKKPKNVGVVSTNIYNPLTKTYSFVHYIKKGVTRLYNFAGASVFRQELLNRVGYFDADFFCWQHEDDLAIRTLEAGYEIHFDPNIIVNHYKKQAGLRKDLAFLYLRNLVWFNIKHFSWYFFPFLIARNIVSLLLLPLKQKSAKAFFYGLAGYLVGWLSYFTFLKKRKVVSFEVQKNYLQGYLFNRLPKNA